MSLERPDTELERSMPLLVVFSGGAFTFAAFAAAGSAASGLFLSAGLAFTFLGVMWIAKYPAYSLRVKPEKFGRMDEHE